MMQSLRQRSTRGCQFMIGVASCDMSCGSPTPCGKQVRTCTTPSFALCPCRAQKLDPALRGTKGKTALASTGSKAQKQPWLHESRRWRLLEASMTPPPLQPSAPSSHLCVSWSQGWCTLPPCPSELAQPSRLPLAVLCQVPLQTMLPVEGRCTSWTFPTIRCAFTSRRTRRCGTRLPARSR